MKFNDGTYRMDVQPVSAYLLFHGLRIARVTMHTSGWWRALTNGGKCVDSGYDFDRIVMALWNQRKEIDA